MLPRAGRRDVPAACARHPLFKQNSHNDHTASGCVSVCPFIKSLISIYFLLKEIARGATFIRDHMGEKRIQSWYWVNEIAADTNWCKWEKKLGFSNVTMFWRYHFPQGSFCSVILCVIYSPNTISQFPNLSVTFSNILSALLSNLSN